MGKASWIMNTSKLVKGVKKKLHTKRVQYT